MKTVDKAFCGFVPSGGVNPGVIADAGIELKSNSVILRRSRRLVTVIAFLFMFVHSANAAAGTVTVSQSAPSTGATVTSPVQISASATTTSGSITGWHVYDGGTQTPLTSSTSTLNGSLDLTTGAHTLITRAWDSEGNYGDQTITINVAAQPPVTVTQTSPADGATLSSPVQVSASATTTSGSITGWHVYDGTTQTPLASGSATLNGSLDLTTGSHTLLTRAWNSAGDYGDQTRTITVSQPSSGFDSYPNTANKLVNLDQAAWADYAGCGPGCVTPATHRETPVSTPSLDGMAMSFLSADYGGKIAGDLAYTHFTSTDATNWIMDYYEYLNVPANIAPLKGIVALEVDGNQTGTGNFVFGTECNYGYNTSQKTVWRFWTTSGATETWGTTATPCPITQAKHWYHVQVHFVRLSSSTYQVARLKVTDVTDNNNAVQDVSNLGTFNSNGSDTSHGNGVDAQLDIQNDSFNVIIDKWTVIRW